MPIPPRTETKVGYLAWSQSAAHKPHLSLGSFRVAVHHTLICATFWDGEHKRGTQISHQTFSHQTCRKLTRQAPNHTPRPAFSLRFDRIAKASNGGFFDRDTRTWVTWEKQRQKDKDVLGEVGQPGAAVQTTTKALKAPPERFKLKFDCEKGQQCFQL